MSTRVGSGMLDPIIEHHLALHEQLAAFGRALTLGRASLWTFRGLCLGLLVSALFLLVRWLALPIGPDRLPPLLLLTPPIALAALAGGVAAARPQPAEWVARRVDGRLCLAERTLTALAAPRSSERAGPLHLWQLRDAVEHLRRADPLQTFPPALPQREVFAALGMLTVMGVLLLVPSPFPPRDSALDARGQLVRDEAERLTLVAQSLGDEPALQSRDLEQVRELLRQAAQTLDQQLNSPERAAAALDEIERQLQAMADGDQGLAGTLAAVASALAASPETRDLGLALQSGDLKEASRAARDLARQTEGMSESARSRAGRALRSAGQRTGDDAAGVGRQLGQAADGLDPSGAMSDAARGLSERDALAQAQAALRALAESSAAAAARERARAALEGSRNALNRGQPGSGQLPGDANGRQAGSGMPGDTGGRGERGASAESSGEGQPGASGYGTGTLDRRGEVSRLDAVTRPEQVRSGQPAAPDELGEAPLLQAPGGNTSRVGDEAVEPQFEAQAATDPGQDTSIPLGLRELVKEYFSAPEARQ